MSPHYTASATQIAITPTDYEALFEQGRETALIRILNENIESLSDIGAELLGLESVFEGSISILDASFSTARRGRVEVLADQQNPYPMESSQDECLEFEILLSPPRLALMVTNFRF
ncbi:MAG: hypothetical protein MUF31_14485 [Akkermansiaceae bacterium]|jgi:hypothetical protein|nr:hypothetical protein [Akkermansiaceae bacterium]